MGWELFYWDVPFRSVPIRLLFRVAGQSLSLPDSAAVTALKVQDVRLQPVPSMAPPFLLNQGEGIALSQMPAIVLYVSQRFELMQSTPLAAAQLMKVRGDMNDILCEVTRNNGQMMWEVAAWKEFLRHRLPRWAEISVVNAERYGKMAHSGQPNAVDLMQWAIWGSLQRAFPSLQPWFKKYAAGVLDLLDERERVPPVQRFFEQEQAEFGQHYCGGMIEKSLRQMLADVPIV